MTADWSLGKFDSLGSRKFSVALNDHTVAKRHPHFVHSFNGGQVRPTDATAYVASR